MDKPVTLLLEDTNAGFCFYQKSCGEITCISAGGNSSIFKKMQELDPNRTVVVIADGAAFGAYVDAVVKQADSHKRTALFFPESFEWMVLKSGIVSNAKISDILDHPEDYIEGKEYISWERFFTDVLISATADQRYQRYSKTELLPYYTTPGNTEKILQVIPEQIRRYLRPDGDQ